MRACHVWPYTRPKSCCGFSTHSHTDRGKGARALDPLKQHVFVCFYFLPFFRPAPPQVRQMMGGPRLPTAYRTQSDMDYVGSMVARPAVAAEAGGAGGAIAGEARAPAAAAAGAGGARSAVLGAESQGAIVVRPVSAPSFTVVPREFSLGSPGVNSADASDVEGGASSTAGTLGRATDSVNGLSAASSVVCGGDGVIVGGGGVGYGIRMERGFSGRGDAIMAGQGSEDDSDGGLGEEKKETEAREEKEEKSQEKGGEETEQKKQEGGIVMVMAGGRDGDGDADDANGGVSQVSQSAVASIEAVDLVAGGGLIEEQAEGAEEVADEEPRMMEEIKEPEYGTRIEDTAEGSIQGDDSAAGQLPEQQKRDADHVGGDDGVMAAAGETGTTRTVQGK